MPKTYGSGDTLDILLVDDVETSRVEIGRLLAQLGHRVHFADSGASALQCMQQELIDLVLLDLLMPELDGFEVTRRLREMDSTARWMPVIVMSSLAGDEHFCHALQQGADDYLVKPIQPSLLAAKLQHFGRVLSTQHELTAAAQRQRDIHDHIADPVITVDAAGRLTDANLAACRRFGDGTPAGLLGIGCARLLGAEWPGLLQAHQTDLLDREGHSFPTEVRCSEWNDQGATRYTIVLRDLSTQRAVEQLKDEFLATVSHELRTPLTSICGAVELLASGAVGALAPEVDHFVQLIHRNAGRLNRLIDDLLDLSQLEADRMAVHLSEQALLPLVEEAVAANQGVAMAHQVQLRSTASTDANPHARVDADRLLQVLGNLISNAAKHSPPGSVISVGLETFERSACITVRDQGPGVPAEFRARMFEKFTQADTSDSRARQGVGLGLYVVRLLTERMGGNVSLGHCEPGSEFRIELPRSDLIAGKIWVIDRDSDWRKRLRHWCEPRWQVCAAAHLKTLADDGPRPVLVIADPEGQDSIDRLLAGIAARAGDVPVLIFSDSVDDAYLQHMGLNGLRKSTVRQAELELVLTRLQCALPQKQERS